MLNAHNIVMYLALCLKHVFYAYHKELHKGQDFRHLKIQISE